VSKTEVWLGMLMFCAACWFFAICLVLEAL
jgi:hypothetical protein